MDINCYGISKESFFAMGEELYYTTLHTTCVAKINKIKHEMDIFTNRKIYLEFMLSKLNKEFKYKKMSPNSNTILYFINPSNSIQKQLYKINEAINKNDGYIISLNRENNNINNIISSIPEKYHYPNTFSVE